MRSLIQLYDEIHNFTSSLCKKNFNATERIKKENLPQRIRSLENNEEYTLEKLYQLQDKILQLKKDKQISTIYIDREAQKNIDFLEVFGNNSFIALVMKHYIKELTTDSYLNDIIKIEYKFSFLQNSEIPKAPNELFFSKNSDFKLLYRDIMNSKVMNNFFLKEEHGNKFKDAYHNFLEMINNDLDTFFERVHLIILPRGIKGINIRYLHIFINIGNYTFNYVSSDLNNNQTDQYSFDELNDANNNENVSDYTEKEELLKKALFLLVLIQETFHLLVYNKNTKYCSDMKDEGEILLNYIFGMKNIKKINYEQAIAMLTIDNWNSNKNIIKDSFKNDNNTISNITIMNTNNIDSSSWCGTMFP